MYQKLADKKLKLERLLTKVDEDLSELAQGRLRIAKVNKSNSYYLVNDTKDTCGKYIRKKDIALAKQLAQRDYCERLRKEIIQELRGLNLFLNRYTENGLPNVYEKLSVARKELVSPYELPDDLFIEQWLAKPYTGKGFSEYDTTEYITKQGERVRSKSELLIANTLFEHHIPYKYECPIRLPGVNLIYIDFTILIVPTREVKYIEHFGMMDNEDYLKEFFWKNSMYMRNGIIPGKNLYMLFESKNNPLNTRDLEIMISSIENSSM